MCAKMPVLKLNEQSLKNFTQTLLDNVSSDSYIILFIVSPCPALSHHQEINTCYKKRKVKFAEWF